MTFEAAELSSTTRDVLGAHEREGDVHVTGTCVCFWEEHVEKNYATGEEGGMYAFFRSLLSRLKTRGWKVTRDPEIAERHKILAKYHYVGVKGDLQCTAEMSGRTVKVEFFQELQPDNPNGGRYDSNKLARMAKVRRELRLRCLVEMTAVLKKAIECGYTPRRLPIAPRGMDPVALIRAVRDVAERKHDDEYDADPVVAFNEHWDGEWEKKSGEHRFERDEKGWPTVKEYDASGYNSDRDKRPLRNGDTKYFRDRHGHLQRAVIFTNMNTMWRVVFGGQVTYLSGCELFDCADPTAVPRRLVPRQRERLEALLKKALEQKDYGRVEELARVLRRLP